MQELYSYKNEELIIHPPFDGLLSTMNFAGKYILPPSLQEKIIGEIPEPITITGKLTSNKKFSFGKISGGFILNNCDQELQLDANYGYKIKWEIVDDHKHESTIGFYSPDRKFGPDRLVLNYDEDNNKLSEYKYRSGKIFIDNHILVVSSDKYCCKHDLLIKLTITPVLKKSVHDSLNEISKIEYNGNKIFTIKKKGIYYRLSVNQPFKKLYCLVKKQYLKKSIVRNYFYKADDDKVITLPTEIDYTKILAKKYYYYYYSFTSHVIPNADKIGDYGIVIKRDPQVVSSASVYYEFILSHISKTPDVIVTAAYYNGYKGFATHQIYKNGENVDVVNYHEGPYKGNNNIISGQLDLESSATEIILLIGNREAGISPIGKYNIITFTKFEIKYFNIQR